MDEFVALERVVGTQRYPGPRPEMDDLKKRAELVMGIEERSLQIEEEASARRAFRRVEIAERLLPVGLKVLAALTIVTLIVIGCLAIDRTQFDALVRWGVSLHVAPYAAAVAFSGGMFAVGKSLRPGKPKEPCKPDANCATDGMGAADAGSCSQDLGRQRGL
jgi:hypothetical protein